MIVLRFIRIYIASLFCVATVGYTLGQTDDIVLTYEETIKAAPSESFIVQRPTQDLVPNQNYPVIFVFDPIGNANNGLKPFRKAAREFGYLLMASQSTRNGKHHENFEVAERFINQVLEDYPVDRNRMYVAGFSGGSRLASAIAVLSKQFAGVIGCGSGFSPNASEKPNFESFSYVGVVGNLDMNYAEMQQNTAWLDRYNVSNELFVFDGGHQWPEEETMLRVFGWLEKEAQRTGVVNSYAARKDSIVSNEFNYLHSLVSDKEILLARRSLNRILRNYSSQVPAEISSEMPSIEETNKLLSEENKILAQEISEIRELNDDYFVHSEERAPLKRLKFWRKKIGKLQKATTSNSSIEAKHAQRLLRHIQAVAFESGIGYGSTIEDRQKALFSVQILLLIQPENNRYQQWLQALEEN